jgi:hypothetical protein
MANYITRYGYSSEVDESNFEKVAADLIEELRTEEHEEPDDEHIQVSIRNEHWSITAQVSGLITFDNIDLPEGSESELPEKMYLRNIPDSELVKLWLSVLQENQENLLSSNWVQYKELPEYSIYFYRERA